MTNNASPVRLPLTPLQLGMLVESVRDGRGPTNVVQIHVRMREQVDAQRLSEAFSLAVRNHPFLRARLCWQDVPEPQAEIVAPFAVTFAARAVAPGEIENELQSDRAHGFSFETVPMRIALWQHKSEDYTCVWTFHHSLLDGRSFTRVLTEVFALYDQHEVRGEVADEQHMLDALRLHAEHTRVIPEAARRYFSKHLAYQEDAAPLPMALSFPDAVQLRSEQVVDISAETLAHLRALCRRWDGTPSAMVQAAFALVVARTTATSRVFFGVTRACRHVVKQSADLIGCLINTIPFCIDIDETQSVQMLVQAVRQAHIDVRPSEHLSWLDGYSAAEIEWNGTGPEMLFVYENYSLDAKLGTDTRSFALAQQGKAPLVLAGYEDPERLRLSLESCPSRYNQETSKSLLACVARVLESWAQNPESLLAAHSLLDAQAQQDLLQATHVLHPKKGIETFLERFAQRSVASNIAFAVDANQVNYGEFARMIDGLADSLRAREVQPGFVVALFLPRCVELFAAQIACWKINAVFLPLGIETPRDVNAYMLSDSDAALVITDARWQAALPQECPSVLCLERDADGKISLQGIVGARTSAREVRRDAAYIIYTSGTTGKPKGVVVGHRSLAAHNQAIESQYALTAHDRVLQFTAPTFDVALEEVFPSLRAFATVVLRSAECASSARAFFDFVIAHDITVANIPTAFFHELTRYLDGNTLPDWGSLRLVVIGGEQALAPCVDSWRRHAPASVRLINAYGLTETTITTTTHEITAVNRVFAAPVAIGKAIAFSHAYVLDSARHLVPLGAVGELVLGGECVALEYLAQPELSAERFVPDPFSADPSARMYRSGDLARVLLNGDIEFLGRHDAQVKIRGFRVELAGVAAELERCEGVRQAWVVARGNKDSQHLVAYIVAHDGVELSAAELTDFAREVLSTHAQPVAYVFLARIPVNAHGKVNERELPEPSREDRATIPPTRPPKNEIERGLKALFESVLGLPYVGALESFFERGGHSLRAMRLLDGIRNLFEMTLPLAQLYETPSVAGLAHVIEGQARTVSYRCVVPIQRGQESAPTLIGVHALGVANSYFAPLGRAIPEATVRGLAKSFSEQEKELLEVRAIAAAYVSELLMLDAKGPYRLMAVSLAGMVAFEMAQQLRAQRRDVRLYFFDVLGPGYESVGSWQRLQRHASVMAKNPLGYAREKWQARVRAWGEKIEDLSSKAAQATGKAVGDEMRARALIEQGHQSALRYEVLPYEGDLVLFRATQDIFYSDAYRDSALGWKSVVRGNIEVVDVPGDHLSMLAEPNVAVLARELQKRL